MKRFTLLVALLVVALVSGCGFLQSKPDNSDPKQVLLNMLVRNGASLGCRALAQKKPAVAAPLAQSLRDSVLPLLNGEKPDLAAAQAELEKQLRGLDPLLTENMFSDLEDALSLIPEADRDQYYGVALRLMVTSCERGLTLTAAS